MSNTKKVVKIKESDLVDLIDNIVTEAVAKKKQEWINEQADNGNKTPLLESKISKLEGLVSKLIANK